MNKKEIKSLIWVSQRKAKLFFCCTKSRHIEQITNITKLIEFRSPYRNKLKFESFTNTLNS